MPPSNIQLLYWRANRIVIAALLGVWFIATFGVSYFARELNFNFFGWPFSFWMGAQGAPGLYVGIVGFYAWYMNRLDTALGAAEEETDERDASDVRAGT